MQQHYARVYGSGTWYSSGVWRELMSFQERPTYLILGIYSRYYSFNWYPWRQTFLAPYSDSHGSWITVIKFQQVVAAIKLNNVIMISQYHTTDACHSSATGPLPCLNLKGRFNDKSPVPITRSIICKRKPSCMMTRLFFFCRIPCRLSCDFHVEKNLTASTPIRQ